jgi:E3 Ubiquitin ligase
MIIFGIVLLVAAALALWELHNARGKLRAMAAAETVPCADLVSLRDAAAEAAGAGVFNHACEVVGVTEPGDTGPLTAELSKTECVWHRHVVKRRYEDKSRDSNGNTTTTTRTETVAELTSTAPFHVRDDSGTVLVDPAGITADHAEQVVDRFEPRGSGGGGFSVEVLGFNVLGRGGDRTLGYEYEEWVIRPGKHVYVLGEATDRAGRLVMGKPAKGPFVLSTRSEEELVRGARIRRAVSLACACVGVAGGVALLVAGLLN